MLKVSLNKVASINLIVSMLLLLSLALILENLLRDRQKDATVINLAGRQRMLSQKISKDLYSLSLGLSNIEAIKKDAAWWNLVQEGLEYGNDSLRLPKQSNKEILRLLEDVRPFQKGLLQAVFRAESDSTLSPSLLQEITYNERNFIQKMDEIVNKAEDLANTGLRNLRVWTWALALMVMGSLVFLYFNLIKPTIQGLIDSKRKLSESRNMLELFVKHTPAAVAMFDNQMNYLVASDRWYIDYGLKGENIIGRNHYEVFPEINDLPEWKEDHQRVLAGEVYRLERDRFVREDGKVDWLRYELRPWRDVEGNIGGMIMFTEVITQQVELQLEVEDKANALEKVNAELRNFIYIASHDLQEPLRTALSFTDLLEAGMKEGNAEMTQASLGYIKESTLRMSALVKSLLDYSLIGTKSNFEIVDCNQLVEEVKAELGLVNDENLATIAYDNLPEVRALKLELKLLFHNLLANAIKFSRPNEACKISILSRQEENHILFAVQDNGIGIEKKYFTRIFEVFQRLHSQDEISGTGIGLANCKKIVHLHGGNIWVESEPQKGSTFYFTLKTDK